MKYLSLSFTLLSLLFINAADCNELKSEAKTDLTSLEDNELELEEDILSLEDEILTLQEEITEPTLLEEESPSLLIETSSDELKEKPKILFQKETSFPLEISSIETTTLEPIEEAPKESLSQALQEDQEELVILSEGNSSQEIEISLKQVFAGSPFIYSILFGMSFFSIALWLYSMSRIKGQVGISESFLQEVREKLSSHQFQEVSELCKKKQTLFSLLLSAGLIYRKYGLQAMLEGMKSEGKRSTVSSWQRLSLLQDIAIIAPMLGLLGTVLGMFYAFYDLNRSFESISNLFDGLGISVGTTVAGIAVAILAMILHSTAKFRLIRSLALVESQASTLAYLMEEKN